MRPRGPKDGPGPDADDLEELLAHSSDQAPAGPSHRLRAYLYRLGPPALCLAALATFVLGAAPERRWRLASSDGLEAVNLGAIGHRRGMLRWATNAAVCADIPHGSPHKGNRLQMWQCQDGNPNMQFLLPDGHTGFIRFAAHPHMCLDVLGGSPENGNPIGLWRCGENNFLANQLFRVSTGPPGPIRWAAHPQKCLDFNGGVVRNGMGIRLWDCLADGHHPNQLFLLPAAAAAPPAAPAAPGPVAGPPHPHHHKPHLPGRKPFCGISSNVWNTPKNGNCATNMQYIRSLDPGVADSMSCKEYGGGTDPCSIDIHNDADYGINKNPAGCPKGAAEYIFFLWDEPTTHRFHPTHHCSMHANPALPLCSVWAALTWKAYAEKWKAQIAHLRWHGLKVASPRFHGGNTMKEFDEFFAACPECSHKGSPYYIDILVFNAWVWNERHDNADMHGNVGWIMNLAAQLKKKYDRPVYIGDFASIGAVRASLQADVIAHSRLFASEDSGIDAVYYFAAQDYGGGTQRNGLHEVVSSGPFAGQTLGQVLVQTCRR